jgi:hypothetical protein
VGVGFDRREVIMETKKKNIVLNVFIYTGLSFIVILGLMAIIGSSVSAG